MDGHHRPRPELDQTIIMVSGFDLFALSFVFLYLLEQSSEVSAGCRALHQACTHITFELGTPLYEYEKKNCWSNRRHISSHFKTWTNKPLEYTDY